MSTRNLANLFSARYSGALEAYHKEDSANLGLADEICSELTFSFECPRLTQIRAWQLWSLCTKDYDIAKGRLESSLELISTLDQAYPSIIESKRVSNQMLQELETHRRTIEQKKGSAEKDDMDSDSGGKVEERLESLQVDESTKTAETAEEKQATILKLHKELMRLKKKSKQQEETTTDP